MSAALTRREQTRNQILNAATVLFAERGVSSASMDDIAARADVARGTLYYNFASKEDIVLAIALRAFAGIDAQFRPRLAAGEPAETLLFDLFRTSSHWFVAHRELAPIVLTAPLRGDVQKEGIPSDRPSFRGLTHDILAHGQRLGALRSDIDPVALAQIAAGVFSQAVLVGLQRGTDGLDTWIASLLRVLLEGMRAKGG